MRGGIIVVPNAEEHLPIIRIRGTDQSPITEGITAQHLKHFGLVKYDMLGLATLKIIRRCIELILRKNGNNEPSINDVWAFYNEKLHPDVINPSDKNIFKKVYCGNNFPSIFQFSMKNTQRFCVKAKPENVKDLSNITSIFRPGPLSGKADERYIFYSEVDSKKEHPIIQEILGESRGLIVFQEQFMLLAHKLAGFTLEESDALRKLLVKPSHELGEEMKKQRIEAGEKFIKGCIEKGLTEERARRLWDKEILGFISYGFCKGHAVSYAYNSYQCAFLYTYHEQEWIKACLECDPNPTDTINSVRSVGYKVDKVDVNKSCIEEWFVDEKTKICFPPLTSLKGIGFAAAFELFHRRPPEGFKSIEDFFYDENHNWRWSKMNKRTVDALIQTESFGSLSCVGNDKLFKNYKHMFEFITNNYDDLRKGKKSLIEASLMQVDDWSVAEKIEIQKEIVGFFDKELIISKFKKTFDDFGVDAIDETDDEKRKPRVWAVVEKVVQKATKTGKPFLTISVSGASEKPYTFRIFDMTIDKTEVWKEGNIVVFGLEWESEWGYNLGRWCKPLKVTK